MDTRQTDMTSLYSTYRAKLKNVLTLAALLSTLIVTSLPQTTQAQAQLPSYRVVNTTLLSFDSANQTPGFYTALTHTESTLTRHNDQKIKDLADSLYLAAGKNKTTYIAHAYHYVKSTILPEYRFGLSKGGLGALMDQSGTPFDQAQLLHLLLKEKNIPSRYQFGEVTLSRGHFIDWTNITNARAACQLLADGGFPGSINGVNPRTCEGYGTGTLSSASFSHIWLDFDYNGKHYRLDPSIKPLTVYKHNNRVGSLLGYSGALTNSVGNTFTSTDVNTIKSKLDQLSRNFSNNIRNEEKAHVLTETNLMRPEDVLGGKTVIKHIDLYDPGEVDLSKLSHERVVLKNTFSFIPDHLRTKITLTVSGRTHQLYADATYGGHLAFQPHQLFEAKNAALADLEKCSLKFDGQTLDANLKSMRALTLRIDHPYLNNMMDRQFSVNLNCFQSVAVVQGYGRSSAALAQAFSERAREKRSVNLGSENNTYNTALSTYVDATAGDLLVGNAAYRYLDEASAQAERVAGMANVNIEHHHIFGIAEQAPELMDRDHKRSIVDQALGLNLMTGASVTPRDPNDPSEIPKLATARTLAWLASTLEGSVARHTAGGYESLSTAHRFVWGINNSRKGSNNPIGFETIEPNTTLGPIAYPSAFHIPDAFRQYEDRSNEGRRVIEEVTINKIEGGMQAYGGLKTYSKHYHDAGFRLVRPTVGLMGPGQFPWRLDAGCTTTIFQHNACAAFFHAIDILGSTYGSALFAEKESDMHVDFAHLLIDHRGGAKGGGSGIEMPKLGGESLEAPNSANKQAVTHGVDSGSGALNYNFGNLLSVGTGGFPHALSVSASVSNRQSPTEFSSNRVAYNSGQQPWRSSRLFELNEKGQATVSSESRYLWQPRTAQEAAAAASAIYALLQLNRGDTRHQALGSAVISVWLADQAINNTINISSPRGTSTFVRRAGDNRYRAMAGSTETLSADVSTRFEIGDECYEGHSSAFSAQSFPGKSQDWLMGRRQQIIELDAVRTFANGDKEVFESTPYRNARIHCTPERQPRWSPLKVYTTGAGFNVSYHYNENKYLTRIENDAGRALFIKNRFDNDNKIHSVKICEEKTCSGRVAEITEAGISQAEVKVILPNGNIMGATYAYTDTTDYSGNRSWERPGGWAIESITRNNKTLMQYHYDRNYLVKGVTLHKGQDPIAYYDDGRIHNFRQWAHLPGYAGIEVNANNTHAVTYLDAWGNPFLTRDGENQLTLTRFDAWGRKFQVEKLKPNKDTASRKTYHYKGNNLGAEDIDSLTGGEPIRILRTYNNHNQLLVETVPFKGRSTNHLSHPKRIVNTYNAQRQLTTSTRANGQHSKYHYETSGKAKGLIKKIETGSKSGSGTSGVVKLLNKTEVHYGEYGYPKTYIQTDLTTNATRTYTANYDKRGDLKNVIDPRNFKTLANYDELRRLRTLRYPSQVGGGVDYEYNHDGQLIQVKQLTETGYAITEATYNQLGWMTHLRDPAGDTQRFIFDRIGQLKQIIDPMERITEYRYDKIGRLLCERQGIVNGSAWREYKLLSYNARGNISSYRTHRGGQYARGGAPCTPELSVTDNATHLSYDEWGRLVKTTFPDGSVEHTEYNPLHGMVSKKTQRSGEYLLYTYDDVKLQLETKKQIINDNGSFRPGEVVNYIYDEFGREERVNSDTSLQYTYNGFNEILTASQSSAHGWRTVSYAYDPVGNKKRVTWPDGYSVTTTYDALNRASTIFLGNADNYDGRTYMFARYRYNLQGQVIQQSGALNRHFTYEPDGELDTYHIDVSGSSYDNHFNFNYNTAGQLIQQKRSNPMYQWLPSLAQNQQITPNALNQYEEINGFTNQFDKNGNLTQDRKGTYKYDVENRLRTAVMNSNGPLGALTAHYYYDGKGRRTQKVVNSVKTDYLLDGDHEIAEYDGNSGQLLRRYIYGQNVDELIAEVDESGSRGIQNVVRDRLGSVIAVTDATGRVRSQDDIYVYGPYGEPDTASGMGQAGFAFRYTGRRLDPETGFYYYRARYYDPSVGRFLSTDPVGYQDQMNLYAYVGNDPFNATDPTGMTTTCVVGQKCHKRKADKRKEERKKKTEEQEAKKEENVLVIGHKDGSSDCGGGCTSLTGSAAVRYMDRFNRLQERSRSGREGSCSAPMACAGLGAGTAGTALTMAGGTAGITSKGSFRWYENGWKGNQYITTYDLAKYGKVLGAAGLVAGVLADREALINGQISGSKAALNTGMGLLGFTALWPVSISYGFTELFGAQVGGGAIEGLIRMQEAGIRSAMTF